MGYETGSKAYRILVDNKIVISRDVKFVELHQHVAEPVAETAPAIMYDSDTDSDASDHHTPEHADPNLPPDHAAPANHGPGAGPAPTADDPSANAEPRHQRPQRAAKAPDRYEPQDFRLKRKPPTVIASATAIAKAYEPVDYQDAVSCPEADAWTQAMNDEIASLHANATWVLEPVPHGVKPIPVKWV